MKSETNTLGVKKLLIITLISSSLLLVGCLKQEVVSVPTPEVQKQVLENIQSGSVEVNSGITDISKGYEIINNGDYKTLKMDKMKLSIDFPANLTIKNKGLSFSKENEIEITCGEEDITGCNTVVEFLENTGGILYLSYGEYNIAPDGIGQEQEIKKSDVEKIIKDKNCGENCIYSTLDGIPTSTKIEWTGYEGLLSPVVKKMVYFDNYILFLNLDINFLLENEYIELQKKFPNAEFPNEEFGKMSDYHNNYVKQIKFDEKIINSIKNNLPQDIEPKYQKQFEELIKIINSVKILK